MRELRPCSINLIASTESAVSEPEFSGGACLPCLQVVVSEKSWVLVAWVELNVFLCPLVLDVMSTVDWWQMLWSGLVTVVLGFARCVPCT